MLQIVIFMLGGYFIIKGYEIFQSAILSQREDWWKGTSIIAAMVAWACLAVLGIGGIYLSIEKAKEIQNAAISPLIK